MRRKIIVLIILILSIVGAIYLIHYYYDIFFILFYKPYIGSNDIKTEKQVLSYLNEAKKLYKTEYSPQRKETERYSIKGKEKELIDLYCNILSVNNDSKWSVFVNNEIDELLRGRDAYEYCKKKLKECKTKDEIAAVLYIKNRIQERGLSEHEWPNEKEIFDDYKKIVFGYPKNKVVPLAQIQLVDSDIYKVGENRKPVENPHREYIEAYKRLKRIYSNTYYEPYLQVLIISHYGDEYEIKEFSSALRKYPDFLYKDDITFHAYLKNRIKLAEEHLRIEL